MTPALFLRQSVLPMICQAVAGQLMRIESEVVGDGGTPSAKRLPILPRVADLRSDSRLERKGYTFGIGGNSFLMRSSDV